MGLITFLLLLNISPEWAQINTLAFLSHSDETVQLIERKYQIVVREFEKLKTRTAYQSCELLSVVMPEYLSYSPLTGAAERIYMSIAFEADLKRFGRTSFGPFQMQPDFILRQLNQSKRFTDSELFSQARLNGYSWVAGHLEEFASMDVQLHILLIFEENFKRSYPKGTFEEMVSVYNTGSAQPSSRIFTKLQQADRSYLDWVRYIRAVVNC